MTDREMLVLVDKQLSDLHNQIVVYLLANPIPKPEPIPPDPVPIPPSNVVLHPSLGPSGQGTRLTSRLGVTQAFPMPPNLNGILVSTGIPGTPQELNLEWAISPTVGDFTYAMTPAASVTGRGGVVYHPCIAAGGVESGGVKWDTSGAPSICRVPAGSRWYVNMRFKSGIPPDTDATITYSWS